MQVPDFQSCYFLPVFLRCISYQGCFYLYLHWQGDLIVAVGVYLFARRNGKLQTGYLLIGGIATSAGFSALMLVVGADMENNSYHAVARWLSGNLWGSGWYQVTTLLPYLLILIPLLFVRAKTIDVFAFGEETACGLGVQIERERLLLLIIAVGLSASCISVSGGIGFVGLVAPHIARKLMGVQHKYLLPVSMLMGGILLLAADTLGRSLFQPIEVPVGIVISVLAAPYFLYLLRKAT